VVWRTLLWLVAFAPVGAAIVWLVWRAPPERDPARSVWGTFALGMLLAFPAVFAENALARVAGIPLELASLTSGVSLLFVFAFAAPLEEGLKIAAAWPAFRSGHFDEAFDGVLYATASAAGLGAMQAALQLGAGRAGPAPLFRTAILFLAQPLLSALWGWALGRVRRTKRPSGRFVALWALATLLHGLLEHLTNAPSPAATIAAAFLFAAMAATAWWGARDLLSRFGRVTRVPASGGALASLRPPSLHGVRYALHHGERPVLFHWIPLGAITTTGVMLSALAVAVWAGRRLGLDFSAIDSAESSPAAAAPLLLLALAVLAAFPAAGYLVAKASNSDGVLEPALSAALAIVVVLVMLGLAAPVALVLALAFAPIAFALACAGAWVGVGR
jgi:hypothetical protein